MSDEYRDDPSIETERYELFAELSYNFDFDRREFMKVFGAGLALIVPCVTSNAQQGDRSRQGGESGRGGVSREGSNEIASWIHIDENGSITVYTGKVEMGQNIRTSLAQAVAEELRVPVSMIKMVMGDTDLTPFDSGTSGSRTTPAMAPQLRKAAAAARELQIDLVAHPWS